MSNTGETVPEELTFEAIERVVRERDGGLPAKASGYRFGEMAGRPLEADELAGLYASEIGAIVVGGTPRAPEATIPGMKLRMIGREQQSYGLQVRLLGLVPMPVAAVERIRVVFREVDGRRVLAIYEGGKFRSVALAVAPQPVPSSWRTRSGHYEAANPDPEPFFLGAELGFDDALGFITISVRVASMPEPVIMPLVAIDDETLVTAGLGRRMGKTFRVDSHDGREAILWAGLVLERSQRPCAHGGFQ